jgi:hypothetical protein
MTKTSNQEESKPTEVSSPRPQQTQAIARVTEQLNN